jgi:RNA polymerase sigma factor FliA
VDEGARRRLIEDHLSMVQAIAVHVRAQVSERLDLEELVGYGSEGLLAAARRFDPAQEVKFSTYAWHRVRGAMYDGLREMGGLRRGDYARLQIAARAASVLEGLAEADLGISPTAPSLEDDLRALHDALTCVTMSYVASIEALAARDVAADEPPLDDALDARGIIPRVRHVIAGLPERERHFIEKHYFEGKTLDEAGAELGLSRSWASRLHTRAMKLLRVRLKKPGR